MNIDKAIQSAYKYYHKGDLQQASQICKKILQKRPKNADVFNMLGAICYQLRNFDDAAKYLKNAIALNPHHSDAYSNLGNVHQEQGLLDEAMICVKKSIELNPHNADAYNTLGMIFHKKGAIDSAIQAYQRALDIKPAYANAYHNLGVAFKEKGLFSESISFFEKALQFDTKNSDACFHIGMLLKETGKPDEAILFFQKGLQINPNHAAAYNLLGMIFGEKGQFDSALANFVKAIKLNPHYVDAYSNIGKVFQEQGNFEEAIMYFRKAIQMDDHHALAYNNLGVVFQMQGKTDEAIAHFQKALQLKPDFSDAYYNLGTVLQKGQNLDEAITCFRKAIRLNPRLLEAYNNLGNSLSKQGKLQEACDIFHHALTINPDSALILNNLGNVLKDQGKPSEGEEYCKRAIEKKPDFFEACSNFLLFMNYINDDAQTIYSQHVRLGKEFRDTSVSRHAAYRNDPSPTRKLKIGYVSPDFRQHSVAFFFEPVIREHNHNHFDIFCYSDSLIQDEVTARIRQNADHWETIAQMPNDKIFRLLHEGEIDILVDLTGHTGHNRMSLFAAKPVPVQVSWMGYPGTTGIPAIDYRIVDSCTDHPYTADKFYIEKLIRMPECFLCYLPEKDSPDITDLPAISNGYITFGSFNNFAKISPIIVEQWIQILKAVPNSRLLLKAKSFADEHTRRYAIERLSTGHIDISRIELLPWESSIQAHLSLYKQLDIALDTFPYNGATTTCEALWMGVPVISLAGRTHASRVGLSLLSNIGLPELVATTPQEYIDRAVNLASNMDQLRHFRKNLRNQMAQSSLTDAKKFTAELETVYRSIWKQWCLSRED